MEIEIVRGTTNTFRISLADSCNNPYVPFPGDKLVFGVKKQPSDTNLLIVKTAEIAQEGWAQVKIKPEDTMGLCCDNYYYDVSLESGEDFYNIIFASRFRISHNITAKGCV